MKKICIWKNVNVFVFGIINTHELMCEYHFNGGSVPRLVGSLISNNALYFIVLLYACKILRKVASNYS